jgi:hypothetical protein
MTILRQLLHPAAESRRATRIRDALLGLCWLVSNAVVLSVLSLPADGGGFGAVIAALLLVASALL